MATEYAEALMPTDVIAFVDHDTARAHERCLLPLALVFGEPEIGGLVITTPRTHATSGSTCQRLGQLSVGFRFGT